MKNLKAAIMIILGSFVLATGFAFAGSYETLSGGNPFGVAKSAGADLGPAVKAADVPEASKAAQVQEEKKPTTGEKIKKALGTAKPYLVAAGVGAFIGFALFGPAAIIPAIAIAVGLFVFAGL